MQPPFRSRPRPEGHDPLVGVARLLLDGTNLLHALRRSPEPPPAATLIGRLRAVIPAPIKIVLVFDGRGDGVGTARLASGLTVRYSGRISADRLIELLVAEEPEFTLVVTDDRALARTVRDQGATSIANHWLIRRLARPQLSSPAPGRPRPLGPVEGIENAPPSSRSSSPDAARDAAAAADGRRWTPGRGSTRKRGNPRRGHGSV